MLVADRAAQPRCAGPMPTRHRRPAALGPRLTSVSERRSYCRHGRAASVRWRAIAAPPAPACVKGSSDALTALIHATRRRGPTARIRSMKMRLEGSVRPRAYGRVIRDGGFLGRTQLGRPFWTVRCERGLFIGPPLRLARVVP